MIHRSIAIALLLAAGAVHAATHEVKMLDKGEDGAMVFEPSALKIAPGDTVKFVAMDKLHNAELIAGMHPEGAESFAGKMNQDIEVTFKKEGLYGIKCLPHFAMGMVATIKVGKAAPNADSFLSGRIPPQAKARFQAQIAKLK